MVYEEKFITKYNVPALKAVGWEGTFGFLTLATLLIPFYFIPGNVDIKFTEMWDERFISFLYLKFHDFQLCLFYSW